MSRGDRAVPPPTVCTLRTMTQTTTPMAASTTIVMSIPHSHHPPPPMWSFVPLRSRLPRVQLTPPRPFDIAQAGGQMNTRSHGHLGRTCNATTKNEGSDATDDDR